MSNYSNTSSKPVYADERNMFRHIYDRSAIIVVTREPERWSRDNPNPDTLCYGREVGDPSGTERAYLREELGPMREPPRVRRRKERKEQEEE